ncbi:glycosyltransferase family 4 protein, partial [bacterium]|nr:glycosyltransferase family 4 protein [bacterium]
LFATGDAQTRGRLDWICPRPYEEDKSLDPKVWECLHISHAFQKAGEYDLIHNHFDFLPLSYSPFTRTPMVTTVHGFSSEKILPVYRRFNESTHYVAISDADRHPDLQYLATIHHGIPVEDYEFYPKQGDYLLVFGRIHHDKGVYEAIQLAKEVQIPLVIAGIIQDENYFREKIDPHIDDESIRYIGSVGPDRKSEVLGGALTVLHLINFAEPFGLSVIESMACGTPVIAMRRGSMPEIIADGRTGFLVSNLIEAEQKLNHVHQIRRPDCRSYVEARFTVDRMVDQYLNVYNKVKKER